MMMRRIKETEMSDNKKQKNNVKSAPKSAKNKKQRDVDWKKLDATAFSWQKALGGEGGFGVIV